MNGMTFKFGLERIETTSESLRFTSYYIVKILFLCTILTLFAELVGALRQNELPSFLRFVTIFLVAMSAFTLFFMRTFYRKLKHYKDYWFRFSDDALVIYEDRNFARVWLSIPYKGIISFHHIQYYLWEDRFFLKGM